MANEGQRRIDAYLVRLRERLRGMNDEDVQEVIEELRGHIVESAGAGGEMTMATVDSALSKLGDPEDLASQYLTDEWLARAETSRSPARILDGLFRWASLSTGGFLAFLGSVAGYFFGLVFLLCALLKPFHPGTAGLWVIPDGADDVTISLRLGFESAPVGGREVLHWWIVPLGLVLGCGIVVLTTRFALWCIRQYRKSLTLPRG
jgi:uncharacterized membrane protein